MSNSTNVNPSTIFHDRTRPFLTNSGHCLENRTGSHLEDEVTATFKTTPIKETRKSLRQFILRNKSNYIEHAKEYKEEIIYMKALKALNKNRSENPAYKEIFNSLNLWYSYDLKKKNPKWNRTSVDDLTARTLFTEDNTEEELWFWQQTMLNIIQPLY